MDKYKIGFAFCGSYCTYKKVLPVVRRLAEEHEPHRRWNRAQNILGHRKIVCLGQRVTANVAADRFQRRLVFRERRRENQRMPRPVSYTHLDVYKRQRGGYRRGRRGQPPASGSDDPHRAGRDSLCRQQLRRADEDDFHPRALHEPGQGGRGELHVLRGNVEGSTLKRPAGT